MTLTLPPLLLALFVLAFMLWATSGTLTANSAAGRWFVIVVAWCGLGLAFLALVFTALHDLR